jgi:hypothetical protein
LIKKIKPDAAKHKQQHGNEQLMQQVEVNIVTEFIRLVHGGRSTAAILINTTERLREFHKNVYISTLSKPMLKHAVLLLLFSAAFSMEGRSQKVISAGVFTGFTVPYTFDAGINKDSRYKPGYNIRFAPVGFHLGIDYEGFGVMIDPNLFSIGQRIKVINTSGGQAGTRDINLQYVQIPVGFKIHMIDLTFFKVSFVGSLSPAFLISGEETITHLSAKLKFPEAVLQNLPPGYTVEYDGVIVPDLSDAVLLEKSDYQQFQLFGAVGFRSDWDLGEKWRVSFDLRANYGILEPRTPQYLNKIKANQAIYDLPGQRRDLFVGLNVGVSRTLEIDRRDLERKQKKKSLKRQVNQKFKPGQRSKQTGKKSKSPTYN